MIIDIFSSFDPATCLSYSSLSPSIFWFMTFFSLSLSHGSLWPLYARFSWLPSFPTELINSQVSRTFSIHLNGLNSILVPLFVILILLNLIGLIPYVFSPTSHLLLTLSFGLPLWLSFIISAISHAPSSVAASLLPSGAPDWLNPFLVITETLSICMRFITLSFRIGANISAGHILLGLIGIAASSVLFSSLPTALIIITIELGYTIFEIGICLIQAYIFCLLLSLYSDDHPSY